MSEHVDEGWEEAGLDEYSTAAIIGTLNRFGVPLDEAGLKQVLGERWPLELAQEWKRTWTGTGDFASFPWEAANELCARFWPKRPTPRAIGTMVIEAIAHGQQLVAGRDTGLAAIWSSWEAQLAILPSGERRTALLGEVVVFLNRWFKPFNATPVDLARSGHTEQALRFAQMQETVYPERAGCITAKVRALSGERAAALADLTGWADEATREVTARFSALEVLSWLEEYDLVKAHGLAVFDLAAKAEQWPLAHSIARVLAYAVANSPTDLTVAQQIAQRLELAHGKTEHDD